MKYQSYKKTDFKDLTKQFQSVAVMLKYISKSFLLALLLFVVVKGLQDHAKDNGDIYIINYNTGIFDGDIDDIPTTTLAPRDVDFLDFDEIMSICNASFITPESHVLQFNTTASLPDEKDKTSLCYFRCFFEKSGILENFKLNPELVRKYVWPATGDSIEYCEAQGMDEKNPCVRAFAIMKCAMLRALTDARNNPMF